MPSVPTPALSTHGPDERALLVWRVPTGWEAASTSLLGGGLIDGPSWLVNASVEADYARMDPVTHLEEIAAALDLMGQGIGLMTAVDVTTRRTVECDGVIVTSTTGVTRPVLAGGDPTGATAVATVDAPPVGTINTVCWVPAACAPGARLNLLTTSAEAKAQALFDAGVPGTGTASDAVVVLTWSSADGVVEPFGGPASHWGARLGHAVYSSISEALNDDPVR